MSDTAVVFNAIGRDTSVTSTLNKIKGAFRITSTEATAAMRQASSETQKLDHEINQAKNDLEKLARAFAVAGTAAERIDISKKMARQTREIKKLTTAKDLLPDASELFKAGSSAGVRLGLGLSQTLAKTLSSAGPAMGAALAVASPFIAATIAGAVVGAAGVGGVVGGVMIAARDARVQSAAKALGTEVSKELQRAAEPFVPAMISSIGTVRNEFGKLRPVISEIFANSARYLGPLTAGVTGMVRNIVLGFAQANAAAGPVIAMFADKLPALGAAIGAVFSLLADNAEGGAVALGLVFDSVAYSIFTVVGMVNLLAEAFDFARNNGLMGILGALGVFDDLPGKIDPATSSAQGFQAAMNKAKTAAGGASAAVRSLKQDMDELADSNISAYEAEGRAKEAIKETTKALKDNGRTHDANTVKGRANRSALMSLAGAFNQATSANDKAGVAGKRANAVYDSQRAKFIAAAQAAGYTAREAQNLANKVLKIPNSKTINIKAMTGSAQSKIDAIKASLDRVPGSKTITIKAFADIPAGMSLRQLMKEDGGPVRKGQAYIVGEKRPEVFVPHVDGEILPRVSDFQNQHTSGSTAHRPGGAPAASGGVRIEFAGERQVLEFIRSMVRRIGPIEATA